MFFLVDGREGFQRWMHTPDSNIFVVSADTVEGLLQSTLAVEKLDDEKS